MSRPTFLPLLLLLTMAAELQAAPVRFLGELAGGGSVRSVTLHLIPQNGTEAPRTVTLPVPGETVVDLPEGGTWQVQPDSPDLWSPPQWTVAGPGDSERRVPLRFFPAATAAGVLKAPAGAAVPASLDLRVEPSPSFPGPRPPATPLRCPIENGRFRCAVPAGRLDLRVRAGSFIPAYLWDVELHAGESRDLGIFPLKTGASVVGWVRDGQAKGLAGARVRLEPQTLGIPESRAGAAGLRAMALETKTDERGFFQFAEAPPGLSVVTAAREGFAAASRAGVEVREHLEAAIVEPLVLGEPLTFRLNVDPPVSPSGAPWQITLERKALTEGLPGEVFRGDSRPDGTWERQGLAPGPYRLGLKEGETGWLSEEIEIAPDRTTHSVSLPGVRIRGRLRIGDEPLSATLWFGGRSAPRRARFQADEEGRFEGLLPEEGTWDVELASEGKELRVRLAPVEVRKLPGKGHAEVDLRVPNTRLRGHVVDERGTAVPRARLLIQPQRERPNTAETDDEGEFEVVGLRPGPLLVRAEEGERESPWLETRLEEDRDTPSLRLVLQVRRAIPGRVYSYRGPVPGARVQAMSEPGEAGAASGDEAVTGPAGEFTVKLPGGTRRISLNVIAPGYAIRMLAVPLAAEPLLEISLEPVGGTLVFDFGDRTVQEVLRTQSGLLAHGGTFVPFGAAARWAQMQQAPQPDPHRLVLPNMEAGEYLLCFGREAQGAVPKGLDPPPGQCSRGYLSPLQELTLTVAPGSESFLDSLLTP